MFNSVDNASPAVLFQLPNRSAQQAPDDMSADPPGKRKQHQFDKITPTSAWGM
jgi:hypothetical protein